MGSKAILRRWYLRVIFHRVSTKKFVLEYLVRNGGAVDFKKSAVSACAKVMHSFSGQFFAGAAFTCDKDGNIRLGSSPQLLTDAKDCR
ncbi:hypothetical protein GCM10011507_09450 [Edaphobacter acidisoli]|uniref:Uncharacterized protein n=1 Tax=Edaphobacter acidisoli TaxID=2040573 RepID=A0A916RMX5_9BACT|nr:hypothetical protein GCM10011507_09450 [Edaphobacter acidisoli]